MTEKVGGVSYDVEMDVSEVLKADKVIDKFSADVDKNLTKTDKSLQKLSTQTTKTSKAVSGSFSKIGRNAGQAGVQVQQFIGQVQGGQSAMLALSQQAADLGIVLGLPLAGAIAGITASIAGPLYSALTNGSDAVESFKIDIDELTKSMDELSDLSKNQIAAAIIDVNENMDELSKQAQSTGDNIFKLSETLDKGFKDTAGRREIKLTTEETEELEKELIREQATLDELNSELEKNRSLLIELTTGTQGYKDGTKETSDAIDKLSQSLQAQVIALEQGEEAAFRYATAQQLGLTAAEQLPAAIDEQINQIFYLKSIQEQQLEAERNLRKRNAEELKQQQKQQIDLNKELEKVTDRSLDRMANGIANVIVEGGSLNDMFSQIGRTILTETLTALIRFGIQQGINAAIATSTSNAVTANQVANNATIAASAAPAAALQSTATFGTAAVVGGAALLATLAIAKGAGRRTGGNVSAGMMHEVGEVGPELLSYGNKNYLIPGRNGSITPTDQMGGGSNVDITIINNTPANVSASTETKNGTQSVTLTIDDIASDIRGRGKVFNAITQTTTAQNRGGR